MAFETKHMARKREAERDAARKAKRAEFEEHHRVHHQVSLLRGVTQKVKETAQRIARSGRRKPKAAGGAIERERNHRQVVRAMDAAPAEFRQNLNHVLLPMPAVNKAASTAELFAISAHIQGFILSGFEARRSGVATYGQGPHHAALADLPELERAELIGMHSHVNVSLGAIPEHKQTLEVIVMQTLAASDGRVPSLSEIGGVITRSDDERVRKGGVIGYYRAIFQSLVALQDEFRIKQAVRRVAAKKAGKVA